MRKITEQAVKAFLQGKNFKKGNTKVIFENNTARLFLHENLIACKHEGGLFITLAGWNTATTRERLNGLSGVHITQKNFIPYLNGEAINSSYWYEIK